MVPAQHLYSFRQHSTMAIGHATPVFKLHDGIIMTFILFVRICGDTVEALLVLH